MRSVSKRPVIDDVPDVPRAADVLIVVPIAIALGAVARAVGGPTLGGFGAGLVMTGGVAALLGVPAAAWLLTRRTMPWWKCAALGAFVSVLPAILALMAAAVGLFLRHDFEFMVNFFKPGAPIPSYGRVNWDVFAMIVLRAAATGAAAGAVFWGIDRGRASRRAGTTEGA